MKENKTISRQEAISLMLIYYGKEICFTEKVKDAIPYTEPICSGHIKGVEDNDIASFHFTGLRTIDEMTEEETKKSWTFINNNSFDGVIDEEYSAEYFDYLRSRGIATNNEHLYNYLIKDCI